MKYFLVLFRSFALLLVIILPFGTAHSGDNGRGWQPQKYSVQRDDDARTLTLKTNYYTIVHNLKRGGTISKIRLTHGKAPDLLLRPIETTVQLEKNSRLVYSNMHDNHPKISHTRSGNIDIVTVESALLDGRRRESGVKVRTVYQYGWGYIKVHKEIIAPGNGVKIRNLCLFSTILHPSLSDYGYRPGIREIMEANLFGWRNGQIRQWGKIRPGTHFDMPFKTRQIPRYLVFANHGIEGIEWFMSDDLWQWDYQMTGTPGTGFCEVKANMNPLGIAVSIYPAMLSLHYQLPRGGAVKIKGNYSFDYYIGIPILEGHANNPWLCTSIYGIKKMNRKPVTEEDIIHWADSNVQFITLHHDGNYSGDGIFWRDGSYPPYPEDVMKRMDEIIELCHKHGIQIMPYFSNHELHQSTEEFKKHGNEWGRMVDTQGNLRPNYYFGAHMCLKSEWLNFLKFCVDRVLDNHDFDGVYFDWNIAMFCGNPLHVERKSDERSGQKDLALPAISPTTHWDIDELIDLMEWTRERVGQDGTIILHNTLVPMFATENFATQVLGMEFTYGKLSISIPKPNELPLEWNFAGARPRGVIGYGTIMPNAPKWLFKAHTIQSLMTSVTPWRVSPEAIEYFKILKPLGDLEQYRFEDWRNDVVTLSGKDCFSAVYSRAHEAYILLANPFDKSENVTCHIKPDKLPFPLSSISSCTMVEGSASRGIDVRNITGDGAKIDMAGTSIVLLHLTK